MKWLTEELKEEIIKIFEPLYDRTLSEEDIREIAQNLTSVVEVYVKNEYARTE